MTYIMLETTRNGLYLEVYFYFFVDMQHFSDFCVGCLHMHQIIMTNANNQKISSAPPARKLFRWYKNIDDVSEDTKNGVRI